MRAFRVAFQGQRTPLGHVDVTGERRALAARGFARRRGLLQELHVVEDHLGAAADGMDDVTLQPRQRNKFNPLPHSDVGNREKAV